MDINVIAWLLTGGAVGWLFYSVGLNAERGIATSIGIGAASALVGAKMVVPLFAATAEVPGDFDPAGLLVAAAAAAAALALGNLILKRWGV